MRLRLAAGALGLATLAACGTTVPPSQLGAPGPGTTADGLTVPGTDPARPDDRQGPAAPGSPSVPGSAPGTADRPAAGPAPGAPPRPGTGSPRAGTAADRSPLAVGVVTVNNDAASSAGVDNGNTFTARRVAEALVRAANERGGLAGRRVVASYAEIRSSSASFAADLQAVCERFTRDESVAVVLSFLGLTDEQFADCLAKAGVPHVNGSYGVGDAQSQRIGSTTVAPQGLTVERRLEAQLRRLAAAGHLTRTSRIGVVVEGCPYNERGAGRVLEPTARALGLTVASRVTTRCFEGIGDLSGLASDAQGAVLRFVQDRVDRVVVVSSVEANVLLVFMTAAESQGYRPGYALTSLALPNVLQGNVPAGQLPGVQGLGWLPAVDADGDPAATAAARACLATLRGQGLTPAGAADRLFAFMTCDAFELTAAVLRSTAGAASAAAFAAGLDRVGTGFAAASVTEGRTDLRSGRRDGAGAARVFGWAPDCSCFRYRSPSAAV